MGAGLQRLPAWRSVTVWTRAISVGALCVLVAVAVGQWPVKAWHDYRAATPLDLPGARLIRVDEKVVHTLQQLTKAVRKNCDTFYSAPGFDILYFYSQLPEPTGQLANWAGVLSVREQRDIAYELRALERKHTRVCFVRDERTYPRWKKSSYATGPLGKAVAPFRRPVARVGQYTVLRYGRGSGSKPRSSGKQAPPRRARAGS
jgi:hypothetical protein